MAPAPKPVASAGATIQHSFPIRPTTLLSGTSMSMFPPHPLLGGDYESALLTSLVDRHQHQARHRQRRLAFASTRLPQEPMRSSQVTPIRVITRMTAILSSR